MLDPTCHILSIQEDCPIREPYTVMGTLEPENYSLHYSNNYVNMVQDNIIHSF